MGVGSLILIVNLKCLKKKWFRVSKFLSHELFYVPWKAYIVTEFQLFDVFLRFHFHTLPLGTQSVQAVSVRKGLLLPKLQNKTYFYTRALSVPLKCCLYLWSEVRATGVTGKHFGHMDPAEPQTCQMDLPRLFCCKTWLFLQATWKNPPPGMILSFMTFKKKIPRNQ